MESNDAPIIEQLPPGLTVSMPLDGDTFMPGVIALPNGEPFASGEAGEPSRSGAFDGALDGEGSEPVGSKRDLKGLDFGEDGLAFKRPKVCSISHGLLMVP